VQQAVICLLRGCAAADCPKRYLLALGARMDRGNPFTGSGEWPSYARGTSTRQGLFFASVELQGAMKVSHIEILQSLARWLQRNRQIPMEGQHGQLQARLALQYRYQATRVSTISSSHSHSHILVPVIKCRRQSSGQPSYGSVCQRNTKKAVIEPGKISNSLESRV
jgi:hypothetical protein